jgi:hypothetical protein
VQISWVRISINHTLSFSYYLEEACPIRVDIYNSGGARVVRAQVDGMPGMNHIDLGKTAALSQGVYFLSIGSNGNSLDTGKFVIMK